LPVRLVSPFQVGLQLPPEAGMMKARVQNLFPVLLARLARLVLFQVGT
jgi:hypothetical protein